MFLYESLSRYLKSMMRDNGDMNFDVVMDSFFMMKHSKDECGKQM